MSEGKTFTLNNIDFQIKKTVNGAGLGLFTKSKIPKGWLVISEEPITKVPLRGGKEETRLKFLKELSGRSALIKNPDRWIRNFSQCDIDTPHENLVLADLKHLSKKCRLSDIQYKAFYRVVVGNQVRVLTVPYEFTAGYAFYAENVHRINHSCDPNTVRVFGNGFKVYYIAIRDIEPEEEITNLYIPMDREECTAFRRKELKKHFEFYCKCSRCQTPCEDPKCTHGSRYDKFENKKYQHWRTRISQLMEKKDKEKDLIQAYIHWWDAGAEDIFFKDPYCLYAYLNGLTIALMNDEETAVQALERIEELICGLENMKKEYKHDNYLSYILLMTELNAYFVQYRANEIVHPKGDEKEKSEMLTVLLRMFERCFGTIECARSIAKLDMEANVEQKVFRFILDSFQSVYS